MSTFLEKIESGHTTFDNVLYFMMSRKEITVSEYLFMMYVLMLNNFRRHRTSARQLEKVVPLSRETISSVIKSLEAKAMIEIEPAGKFMIIHSNLEIIRTAKISIKSQKQQEKE